METTNDMLLHVMLAQISTLQDKVEALEKTQAEHKDWLESIQAALVRANDEYQRTFDWIRRHDA